MFGPSLSCSLRDRLSHARKIRIGVYHGAVGGLARASASSRDSEHGMYASVTHRQASRASPGFVDYSMARLGRAGPSPRPSCGSVFRMARLGRAGPSPRPSCGSVFRIARLGRAGPSPRPSCGSVFRMACLGRAGPSPRPSCGSVFRMARLGRAGPSPRPSCGSHYAMGYWDRGFATRTRGTWLLVKAARPALPAPRLGRRRSAGARKRCLPRGRRPRLACGRTSDGGPAVLVRDAHGGVGLERAPEVELLAHLPHGRQDLLSEQPDAGPGVLVGHEAVARPEAEDGGPRLLEEPAELRQDGLGRPRDDLLVADLILER